MAGNGLSGGAVLPLVIRLSAWCDFTELCGKPGLETFLADEYPELDSKQWLRELERGRVLLLFDGLDEVHDPEDRFISSSLKRALGSHRECPAAIACRTFAFPIYHLVFRARPMFSSSTCSGASQILGYARVYATVTSRVKITRLERRIREVLKVSSLAALAGNPLLLSVMCFVLGEPGTASTLAVRAQLFNKAVSLLLDRSRRMTPQLDGRLRNWRRPVLEFASLEIFERQTGQDKAVVLDGELVVSCFKAAAEQQGLKPADGLEVLRDVLERGLINERKQTLGRMRYEYLHLQFHEYLPACGMLGEG